MKVRKTSDSMAKMGCMPILKLIDKENEIKILTYINEIQLLELRSILTSPEEHAHPIR